MSDKLRGGTTIGGYTAWHRGNDGPGSGLDADLIDGVEAIDLCQHKVITSSSSSGDNNKYTKFMSHEIGTLYDDIEGVYIVQTLAHGIEGNISGILRVRSKQQNAFGSDPWVYIEAEFNSGAELDNIPDFGYVITQNTPSSTIDFYVYVPHTYTKISFIQLAPNSSSANTNTTITYFDLQAYSATVTNLVSVESTRNITSSDVESLRGNSYIETEMGTDVIDTYIYDTSKDSDGGEWRNRTKHTSWYQEDKNTTTRGRDNKFPAVVALVLQARKLTIYDLTKEDIPMWMVIDQVDVSEYVWWRGVTANFPGTSVCMKNGQLCIGTLYILDSSNANGGICCMNFIKDTMFKYSSASTGDGSGLCQANIIDRHSTTKTILTTQEGGAGYNILNYAGINDIDMTVLASSPIDPVTKIKYPTIIVATDDGIDVIDGPAGIGTAINITCTDSSYETVGFVKILQDNKITFGLDSNDHPRYTRVEPIPSTNKTITQPWKPETSLEYYDCTDNDHGEHLFIVGSTEGTIYSQYPSNASMYSVSPYRNNGVVYGTNYGMSIIDRNTIDPFEGMVCDITETYISGWMHSDIKGSWIADNVPYTFYTDTERILNGTFGTNIDHWSSHNSAALALSSNRISVSSNGTLNGNAYQIINTQIGAEYVLVCDFTKTTVSAVVAVSTTPGSTGDLISTTVSDTGTVTLYFRANALTTYIRLGTNVITASTYCYFDNISVKQIVRDRSICNKPLFPIDTLSSTNEVSNGDFASDTIWVKGTGWTINAEGAAECSGAQTGTSNLYQTGVFTVGKRYSVTLTMTRSAGSLTIFIGLASMSVSFHASGTVNFEYTCTVDGTLYIQANADFVGSVDDVTAYEILLYSDVVNTDTDLVAIQGFGADSGLTQPLNTDLDFDTNDFYVMGWINPTSLTSQDIIVRRDGTGYGFFQLDLQNSDGSLQFYTRDFGNNVSSVLTTTCDLSPGLWYFVAGVRRGGDLYIYTNSVEIGSNTTDAARDVDNADAVLYWGNNGAGGGSFNGKMALMRIGEGSVTQEQISKIYHEEKELFKYEGKSLFGSPYVKHLDYDEDYDHLYVGTDEGIYEFNGLTHNIIDNSSDCTSLSAVKGKTVYSDDNTFYTNMPKIDLREELERGDFITEYERDGLKWGVVNCSCNIFNGQGLLVDSSSTAHSITLPANPQMGWRVGISDYTGNSGTNNITVSRNASKILGLSEDLSVDYDYAVVTLVYTDDAEGWVVDSATNITV